MRIKLWTWLKYTFVLSLAGLISVKFIGPLIPISIDDSSRKPDQVVERQKFLDTPLSVESSQFLLDGKPFRLFSGTMDYFRVPNKYWEDRLSKLQACGLNTVETAIPWNLHEFSKGKFHFSNDAHNNLDIVSFLKSAQTLGLYVTLRIGPFIGADWEWGGLPAWLLSNKNVKVRTTQRDFMEAVETYFAKLLPLLVPLTHRKGGPVIAIQLENEYGAHGQDPFYLRALKNLIHKAGIKEFMFTADLLNQFVNGTIDDVLATVIIDKELKPAMDALEEFRPNLPLFVSHFSVGRLGVWGDKRSRKGEEESFKKRLNILLKRAAGVNLAPFCGGTNFGFMAGARHDYTVAPSAETEKYKTIFQPATTSYEHDGLLSDNGEPTKKWHETRQLMQDHNEDFAVENFPEPEAAPPSNYHPYGVAQILPLSDLLSFTNCVTLKQLEHMETFCDSVEDPTEKQSCRPQYYGFIAYRKTVKRPKTIEEGTRVSLRIKAVISDRAYIVVNGKTMLIAGVSLNVFTDMQTPLHFEIKLPLEAQSYDIILLVENLGRISYEPQFYVIDEQRKGLQGTANFADGELTGWQTCSLDFSPDFWKKLKAEGKPLWRKFEPEKRPSQPALYRFRIHAEEVQGDTFFNMNGWNKGNIFVNGFNLGRYWKFGPQKTLYLPSALLKTEVANEVVIFELQNAQPKVFFTDTAVNMIDEQVAADPS